MELTGIGRRGSSAAASTNAFVLAAQWYRVNSERAASARRAAQRVIHRKPGSKGHAETMRVAGKRLIVAWPAEVVGSSVLVGYRHQSSCPTGVALRHPVLERCSNIRMLAKQTALEEIDRRRAA
jgi:hypothetical protein